MLVPRLRSSNRISLTLRNSVYNQGQIYGNCGYGFLIGTPRKTNVDRSCVHGMSGRYYEASNDENMYNISSEASRSSPLGSPNPRGKGKREGLRESSSVPSLGRDTLKRNTEEGNKREVRASLLQRYFFFRAEWRLRQISLLHLHTAIY